MKMKRQFVPRARLSATDAVKLACLFLFCAFAVMTYATRFQSASADGGASETNLNIAISDVHDEGTVTASNIDSTSFARPHKEVRSDWPRRFVGRAG